MRTLAYAVVALGLTVGGATAALAQSPAAAAHDTAGDADTTALNLLEAHGYTDIKQFNRAGGHYEAVVQWNGQLVTLTVDPATGVVQQHS